MTELQEFLRRVIEGLEVAQIPYMLVGSVASSAHGNPRSTYDLDIVIAPTAMQLSNALSEFQKDLYADLASAEQAMANRSMFNVIDFKKGLKADLIILKDREFGKVEFERRQKSRYSAPLPGLLPPKTSFLARSNGQNWVTQNVNIVMQCRLPRRSTMLWT